MLFTWLAGLVPRPSTARAAGTGPSGAVPAARVLLLCEGGRAANLERGSSDTGALAGGAARLRADRLVASPLDTLAMKFSAEPLSTGGGTQVRARLPLHATPLWSPLWPSPTLPKHWPSTYITLYT